jgi:hypothetical protein
MMDDGAWFVLDFVRAMLPAAISCSLAVESEGRRGSMYSWKLERQTRSHRKPCALGQ